MEANKLIEQFHSEGFVVAPSLFSAEEVDIFKAHFMALNDEAGHGFDIDNPHLLPDEDPLKAYPRIIHSHRWDKRSLDWLLDDRMREWTTALLGMEPYAAQTMFYFKPPGARGQALHQDQKPLRVQPGTCLAAWMAVDDCDEENGCLQIVPRTHDLPMLCPIEADMSQSFSDATVPIPPGSQPEPIIMKAGDVVFFNGYVIHGSFPNRSETRFRRSLIAHYIVGEAEKVNEFYHPVLNFAGEEVDLLDSQEGGPCGVFATEGEPAVTMIEQ